MYLGKADVNTYDKGVEREFLVSNGTGSYGSSTVVGANTRSEHGLLVVRAQNSAQHTVLASKLEETLYAHNKKYQLSTNRYKDLIYPDGYRYLQEYQGTPFPSMLFVIHSIFLKKSIFMPQGGSSTIIKYELIASPATVCMDIRPLFAHRANNEIPQTLEKAVFESSPAAGSIGVRGRGFISHVSFTTADDASQAKWSDKPLWFENVIYEKDERLDGQSVDCLWSPGFGTINMNEGDVVYVVFSEEPVSYTKTEIEALERETVDRIGEFVRQVSIESNYSSVQDMIQSSCHLVAETKGAAPTIFSGFPSVEQRARDTFIALPGLTLVTGRAKTASGILENWLAFANEHQGHVPASIDHNGDPAFGDIDAGLWFLYAADKYFSCSQDGRDFARANHEGLKAVLEGYTKGLGDLGAAMDSDSKLMKYFSGSGTRHWMSGDAGGEPLVDRRGCLVEVNALWYNALSFMKKASDAAGDSESSDRYAQLASECRESFLKTFWNERKNYLFDWVDPENGKGDDTIRPNALLAVSLPHPVLPDDKGRLVLATTWNELYTTYGLRTLDPRHEKFKGRAEGRPDQKKKARLRGMAWPWMLGQFISAYMRYNPDSYEIGWSFIRPFTSHLRRGCLGGVAEYFDGMMPYMPNGDVLSAISLGELLRAIHDDLDSGGA
ncbi:MAG: amylo-alpha-1,6-glucosidase [Synergistaceae bacterium]|jgi:predicted glycogen debranching enzyme|nr:amylo-alpha-1,6-glucosidase [Synergistaceae bacterium]